MTCEGCHSLLGFEEAENQSTVVKYFRKSNELNWKDSGVSSGPWLRSQDVSRFPEPLLQIPKAEKKNHLPHRSKEIRSLQMGKHHAVKAVFAFRLWRESVPYIWNPKSSHGLGKWCNGVSSNLQDPCEKAGHVISAPVLWGIGDRKVTGARSLANSTTTTNQQQKGRIQVQRGWTGNGWMGGDTGQRELRFSWTGEIRICLCVYYMAQWLQLVIMYDIFQISKKINFKRFTTHTQDKYLKWCVC